ncbi:MaoC family dehydratase N-terminal domain-containing protein [Rhodococcus erythropolis]|uniref:FAS1-like dehydratase domain-containing protein n=1 Tax=Rhodococcus erythropolis TaxID=1833 RepID=UPI0037A78AE5
MSSNPDKGRITDEGVDRMRMRLDVPYGRPKPPHNREAHSDTIRQFAWSYGDDNPLYSDPDHGASSRWGGMIAPPLFLLTMGENEVGGLPKDVRDRSRGALAGVHLFNSGTDITFYRPIRPGDRVTEAARLVDVVEKSSNFGGGRSVITYNEHTYQNAASREVLAVRQSWYVHTERESSKKAGKEKKVELPRYSEEEIARIESEVLAEKPRGAVPRYWEDVCVGDSLGRLHKGPMNISDIVSFHIGVGTGGEYGWGPLRLAAQRRSEMPGFYSRNEFGSWDVVQRVHWDDGWAKSIGGARPYDYGQMRQQWLAHLCTDWMGDNGWLDRLRLELRKFNYVGDLNVVSGKVSNLPAPGIVEADLEIVNQRGESTTFGEARILLPTRTSGDPELPMCPEVPASIQRAQRANGVGAA